MSATLLKNAIRFEDLNPYTVSGYTVTNEEPMKHYELIKRLKLNRAAAICSAGEVQFFGILPLVKEELILVDHSYDSMYYAMIKFLLLSELGAEDTYRLMTTKGAESFKELMSHIRRFNKMLPCKEISQYGEHPRNGFGSRDSLMQRYELSENIACVWRQIPLELVKKAADKLDLVSFVHGDMTDIVDRGPFDLFYTSNAYPSNGRLRNVTTATYNPTYNPNHNQECFERFMMGIKKRGYVLSSQQHNLCGTLKKKLEPTIGLSSWRYHLYQT